MRFNQIIHPKNVEHHVSILPPITHHRKGDTKCKAFMNPKGQRENMLTSQ